MSKDMRITKTGLTASIIAGDLYFEDVRQCQINDAAELLDDDPTLKAIRVVSVSKNWVERAYLQDGVTRLESIDMQFSLRKENRGSCRRWYAYRRVFGKLHKRYVGRSEDLNEDRLVEIARSLPSVPQKVKQG